MERPNRNKYVNRAGIVTVNYTKALEKYIDFLEAENKQLAISRVSKSFCDCTEQKQVSFNDCCGSDCINIRNIEH